MKLSEIKSNPNNPRIIKDAKFEKLKKSITEFPKMMALRPMVVNDENVILGGNMRFKALKELGYKEVPDEWVKQAADLTDDEARRFIIADNVGFGEHDWEMLANEWDNIQLGEWGIDVPYTEDDIKEMNNPMNEQSEKPFATELDSQSNYIILKFETDIDWIQAKTLFGLKTETGRRANGKAWSQGIGRVLNGVEAINKIQNES